MPKIEGNKNAKRKKNTRRSNNEGSIYQRSSDKRWVGEVTVGIKVNGAPDKKRVYGKTESEVLRKMAPYRDEILKKGYRTDTSPTTKERNFQALFLEWFNTYKAPTFPSSATEENHRIKMRLHIFPVFGGFDIHMVTSARIQRFITQKVESRELSVDQVRRIKQLMNNFFSSGMIKKIIEDNPMDDVSVPVLKDEEIEEQSKFKALPPEMRTKIFKLVMSHPVLKPIITTFTFTGVRPQELIAFEWSNFDLEQQGVKVGKAVKRTVKFDDNGNVIERGDILGKTKTTKSVRTYTMPMIAVEALVEWKSYCKEHNIVSKYVFPNTRNGERRKYTGLQSLLRRFLEQHNLQDEGISLYTFRHTFATILLEQGVHPKVVAEMMGHANTKMVMEIYSHIVSQDVYKKSANALDGAYVELGLDRIEKSA